MNSFRNFAIGLAAIAVASVAIVTAGHFSTPAHAAAAVDPFSSYVGSPQGPGTNAAAVTTSDSVDLVTVSKWIVCGVAGNLNVITKAGSTVIVSCVAGVPIPLVVTRIKATSTTATGIYVITN